MSAAREWLGDLISEALAVAIIVIVGDSVAGMYMLYDPSPYLASYWGVCIAWGLGVTTAIFVTGSVSGCHANPAITLALAIFRGFSWWKLAPYWAAQVFGAIVGAALVYVLYAPIIAHFEVLHHVTRGLDEGAGHVFFTGPAAFITVLHAFVDEIILTALLMVGIFAITDQYNTVAPMANLGAVFIGLLFSMIGAAMGYLEGWPLNPARDFGPRLFCYVMGWGPQALPAPGHYWWVPIAGPLIGGVIGGGLYHVLVRPFLAHGVAAAAE